MLKLEQVRFGYARDKPPLFDGLSVSIGRGELVALAGPNGSGKTTLMRLAGGLLAPWAGSVRFDGTDVSRLGRNDLARRVALVQQDPPTHLPFTAGEVVLMGRAPHRVGFFEDARDREIAREAMMRTRTNDLAGRLIEDLSGGERQRVMLASALAQEPELALLDEPAANLDLRHRIELFELLRGLKEQKALTVLMALHDLDFVVRYCERVIVLRDGAIVADGSPQEALTPERLSEVYGVAARVEPVGPKGTLSLLWEGLAGE